MELTVVVHADGKEYWSEVDELPGCIASGRTLSELGDATAETIGLYLWDAPEALDPMTLGVGQSRITVDAPPA